MYAWRATRTRLYTTPATATGRKLMRHLILICSVERNSGNQLPSITLKASNVLGLLEGYLEEFAGAVGAIANIYVVNTAHPAGEPNIAICTTILAIFAERSNG